jgi:hypothetical protein
MLNYSCPVFIGFDLNLPLDEFGAVNFDYVQNLAGKHAYIYIMSSVIFTMNKLVSFPTFRSCRE